MCSCRFWVIQTCQPARNLRACPQFDVLAHNLKSCPQFPAIWQLARSLAICPHNGILPRFSRYIGEPSAALYRRSASRVRRYIGEPSAALYRRAECGVISASRVRRYIGALRAECDVISELRESNVTLYWSSASRVRRYIGALRIQCILLGLHECLISAAAWKRNFNINKNIKYLTKITIYSSNCCN